MLRPGRHRAGARAERPVDADNRPLDRRARPLGEDLPLDLDARGSARSSPRPSRPDFKLDVLGRAIGPGLVLALAVDEDVDRPFVQAVEDESTIGVGHGPSPRSCAIGARSPGLVAVLVTRPSARTRSRPGSVVTTRPATRAAGTRHQPGRLAGRRGDEAPGRHHRRPTIRPATFVRLDSHLAGRPPPVTAELQPRSGPGGRGRRTHPSRSVVVANDPPAGSPRGPPGGRTRTPSLAVLRPRAVPRDSLLRAEHLDPDPSPRRPACPRRRRARPRTARACRASARGRGARFSAGSQRPPEGGRQALLVGDEADRLRPLGDRPGEAAFVVGLEDLVARTCPVSSTPRHDDGTGRGLAVGVEDHAPRSCGPSPTSPVRPCGRGRRRSGGSSASPCGSTGTDAQPADAQGGGQGHGSQREQARGDEAGEGARHVILQESLDADRDGAAVEEGEPAGTRRGRGGQQPAGPPGQVEQQAGVGRPGRRRGRRPPRRRAARARGRAG